MEERRVHTFQNVYSSFIKPKLSIWPIILIHKIKFSLNFQINRYIFCTIVFKIFLSMLYCWWGFNSVSDYSSSNKIICICFLIWPILERGGTESFPFPFLSYPFPALKLSLNILSWNFETFPTFSLRYNLSHKFKTFPTTL